MSLLVNRLLHRHVSKILWRKSNSIIRLTSGSTDDCQQEPPCPTQCQKTEPPTVIPEGPEPPPCPKLPPPCPPPFCAQIPDPANPCNFCLPVCIDPEYPDLRRLKRNQCWFQQDNGVPMFLKGGPLDTFLFQGTLVMLILSISYEFFCLFA